MKKFFLLIALSGLFVTVVEAQIQVAMKADSTCKTDTLLMPLKARDLLGCNAFRLEFTFNPAVIKFDSLHFKNPALTNLTATLSGTDRIVITWDAIEAIPFGSGYIARIQFTALETGFSALSFDAPASWFKIGRASCRERV